MTAGKGITHSEESIHDSNKVLHGAQLWIALPDSVRHMEPEFHHYDKLPQYEQDGLKMTILAGEMFNQIAPSHIFSPMVGVDIVATKETTITIPLQPRFEYGLMMLNNQATIENEALTIGKLMYLGCGRDQITLTFPKDAHMLLIGGEPFKEEILLWWNFVARTKAEITEATKQWQTFQYFGEVKGYQGSRLTAPDVPL
jgi:redox-sensitive bicupin YhaK (pirin superfamily)